MGIYFCLKRYQTVEYTSDKKWAASFFFSLSVRKIPHDVAAASGKERNKSCGGGQSFRQMFFMLRE